jgi:hypothetical protein
MWLQLIVAALLIVMDSFDEASRALEQQPLRRSIFQKKRRRAGGFGVVAINMTKRALKGDDEAIATRLESHPRTDHGGCRSSRSDSAADVSRRSSEGQETRSATFGSSAVAGIKDHDFTGMGDQR